MVFAVPIRLRIVLELYQQEMSPSQFHREFGGGSVSRVSKHFDRLTKAGWLRRLHSIGPGGRRRGATETVYRATELAFCDQETWAALPYSIRVAFSASIFKEIAELVRRTMEAPPSACPHGRRLSGVRLLLDESGWTRVTEAVTQGFAAQLEEQEDARRRVTHTGEDLFRAASLILACEMPLFEELRVGPALAEGDHLMIPFPVRLSKVFEDEICLQLVDEANREEISVPSFYARYGKRFGLDEATIRRRLAKLVKYGWLKVVREETGGRRRGSAEKFYKATGPALYDRDESGPWAKLPISLLGTEGWQTFAQLSEWVKMAMGAGTLTRREETCLAWTALSLDQQGWDKVVGSVDELHAFVLKEQELAAVRLRRSGEEPVGMVLGLGVFDSPKPVKEL